MNFHPSAPRPRPRLTPLHALTMAVILGGAAGSSRALAADALPGLSAADTAETVKTSWAASVRAALARKAHKTAETWSQSGVASWYGRHFQGRRTSSGTIFNTNALTAAHVSLPMGTKLLVTSEDTGRSVVVTVNDRGPFNNRIIDLSHAAAERIGMLGRGTAHVTIARVPDPSQPATEVAEAESSDTSDQAIKAASLGH